MITASVFLWERVIRDSLKGVRMDLWYEEYYGEIKKHVCDECGEEIEPGEEVVFPVPDGKDYIYCPSCAK